MLSICVCVCITIIQENMVINLRGGAWEELEGGDMGRGWGEEREVELLINFLMKKFKIFHLD